MPPKAGCRAIWDAGRVSLSYEFDGRILLEPPSYLREGQLLRTTEDTKAPGEACSFADRDSSLRSLVVVDHPTTRRILLATLRKLGVEPDVVDGKKAIEATIGAAYDLILLDLQLDVTDSLEIYRGLRNEENGRETRVVAVGPEPSAESRKRYSTAGLDDYLVKPIQEHAVEQVLAQSRGRKAELSEEEVRPETLDRGRLDLLCNLEKQVGEVVVQPMVQSFLESSAEVVTTMREAADSGSWKRLQSQAHGYLGRALNLGAVKVGKICRNLEEQARVEDPNQIDATLQLLEIEIREVAGEFRAYLEEID